MLNYYSVTNNTLVLAGVVGFEPTNHGIKTRCLTPWLHPKDPLIRFNSVILKLVLYTVKQVTAFKKQSPTDYSLKLNETTVLK